MAKPLETFLTEPGTVLAFDFGLARTGVAVGNTVTRTAEPLVILDASTNESRWQSIEALMSEWKPKFLVVGVPRLGDGNPSTLTARLSSTGLYCRRAFLFGGGRPRARPH